MLVRQVVPPTHAEMRCPYGRETASPDAATKPGTRGDGAVVNETAAMSPVLGGSGLCGAIDG